MELTDLKKFYAGYRKFYANHMRKKEYATTAADFDDFLEEIRETLNNMSGGTQTGMHIIKAKLSVLFGYGNFPIDVKEENIEKKIEIPIVILDGSCGRKHYGLSFDDGQGLNIGRTAFKNTCERFK